MLIIGAFLLTSCLKNEEPASLVDLRVAKTEFVRAETAYKLAEAELKKADAALQAAKVENQKLLNDLQRIQNDIQANNLEIAKLNLEKEKARTEEEKERIAAQIALYRFQISEYERENERKIEDHKRQLMVYKQQIATAEAAYLTALKAIGALRIEAQREEITKLVAKIESLRPTINALQTALVTAQRNLIDAQYNWNKDVEVAKLNKDIAVLTLTLNVAERERDDYRALIDNSSVPAWSAQLTATETLRKKLELRVDSLTVEMDKKVVSKTPIQQEKDRLNAKFAAYTKEIAALTAEKTEINRLWTDIKSNYTIAVPASLQDYFKYKVYTANPVVAPTLLKEDATIDPNTGLFTYTTGNFVFEATKANALVYLNTLRNAAFASMTIEKNALEQRTYKQSDYNFAFTAAKNQYEKDTLAWGTNMRALKRYAEIYGLETPEDLQKRAKDAVVAYKKIAAPTEDQKRAMMGTVVEYQKHRDLLVDKDYDFNDNTYKVRPDPLLPAQIFWEKAVEKFVDGTLPLAKVELALNWVALTYNTYTANGDGLLDIWRDKTTALWGIGIGKNIYKMIDEAYFDGEVTFIWNEDNVYVPVIKNLKSKLAPLFTLGADITINGHTTLNLNAVHKAGSWYTYLQAKAQKELYQAHTNKVAEINTFVASLVTAYNVIKDANEERLAAIKVLDTKIQTKQFEQQDIQGLINAETVKINNIEILWQKDKDIQTVLNTHISNLITLETTLTATIAANGGDKTALETIYQTKVAAVNTAKENLDKKVTELKKITDGQHNLQRIIEDRKKDLLDAEKKLENALLDFEFYTKKLAEALAAING